MSGRTAVFGIVYGSMAFFQFVNIGDSTVGERSRLGNWIRSFPKSAQLFVMMSSMTIGGLIWPISLPYMIVRDMKDRKNKHKRD